MKKLVQLIYTGSTCFKNQFELEKLSLLSEVMLGFSIFDSKDSGDVSCGVTASTETMGTSKVDSNTDQRQSGCKVAQEKFANGIPVEVKNMKNDEAMNVTDDEMTPEDVSPNRRFACRKCGISFGLQQHLVILQYYYNSK